MNPSAASLSNHQTRSSKLRSTVLLALWLLAAPLATATLTGFLGRLGWALDLSAHFRLQYAIALAPLVLALACLRYWKSAALLAVPLLVNGLMIASLYLPARSATTVSSLAPPLRLLQFNLDCFNRRYQDVARFIDRSGADLVCLEEVTARWRSEIAAQAGQYAVVTMEAREDTFGIAVLHRRADTGLEIINAHAFDPTNGRTAIPAIEVSGRWHGRELAILVLHTGSPVSPRLGQRRNLQLAAAAAWARRQPGGAVVMGDLNATPWSAAFRPLTAAGLLDSEQGFGLCPTWPGTRGLWGLAVRIPIDHVLHSGNLAVVERRVGPYLGSDHFPLSVSLAWLSP